MNLGQTRLDRVIETFKETGVVTGSCTMSGPGTGQVAWCMTHGWGGVVQDCERDDGRGDGYDVYRCPYWRVAAWIERRHAYAAGHGADRCSTR